MKSMMLTCITAMTLFVTLGIAVQTFAQTAQDQVITFNAPNKTPEFAYVANHVANFVTYGTVSAYTINSSTGALTEVSGSPFAAGVGALSVAVDPLGKFVYVANEVYSTVSVYTNSRFTGALTEVKGSPFAVGVGAFSVAVDPSGKFLYLVGPGANYIYAYTISRSKGALTEVSGSPFATGLHPYSIAITGQPK